MAMQPLEPNGAAQCSAHSLVEGVRRPCRRGSLVARWLQGISPAPEGRMCVGGGSGQAEDSRAPGHWGRAGRAQAKTRSPCRPCSGLKLQKYPTTSEAGGAQHA
jgi:hypothetical protein